MIPDAMPKTVRRASMRGNRTFVTAQNMILPRLNITEPQTEYTTRHGCVASRMCRRLQKYTPKPTWEFSNSAFETSRSYGENRLQNNNKQSGQIPQRRNFTTTTTTTICFFLFNWPVFPLLDTSGLSKKKLKKLQGFLQ